jgi:hypothetical protein
MNTKIFRALLLSTLLFLLEACSPVTIPNPPLNTTPQPFSKLYPLKDMNKSISLTLSPTVKSDLRSGANIFLQVQNLSDQQLWFDSDWQLRIYQAVSSSADTWKLVENGVQYAGQGIVLYPKSGGGASTYPIVCIPLVNGSQAAKVRVVVSGQVYKDKNKTGVPVSAYTEMTINP